MRVDLPERSTDITNTSLHSSLFPLLGFISVRFVLTDDADVSVCHPVFCIIDVYLQAFAA